MLDNKLVIHDPRKDLLLTKQVVSITQSLHIHMVVALVQVFGHQLIDRITLDGHIWSLLLPLRLMLLTLLLLFSFLKPLSLLSTDELILQRHQLLLLSINLCSQILCLVCQFLQFLLLIVHLIHCLVKLRKAESDHIGIFCKK